jgi:hypothetical protein
LLLSFFHFTGSAPFAPLRSNASRALHHRVADLPILVARMTLMHVPMDSGLLR